MHLISKMRLIESCAKTPAYTVYTVYHYFTLPLKSVLLSINCANGFCFQGVTTSEDYEFLKSQMQLFSKICQVYNTYRASNQCLNMRIIG